MVEDGTYPDFLGIGAQKAGTSWLHVNLKHHPGIWMPPLKEIHHFDDPSSRRLIAHVFDDSHAGRRRRVRRALRRAGRELRSPRGEHRLWWLRYLLRRRDDRWYSTLFSPGPGQICGEVTPEYAPLDECVVARIHALMPRARIIYLLRNPIDRAWSQAAMYFHKRHRRSLDALGEDEIGAFLETSVVSRNADYVKNLQVWERFYSPPRIFVGFYEQLVRDPRALLGDIYRFLELDGSDRFITEQAHVKWNARSYPPMPDQFARRLAQRLSKGIDEAHERFASSYTAGWVESAKRILESGVVARP